MRKLTVLLIFVITLVLAPSAAATEPTKTVTDIPGITFTNFLTCPTFGVSGTFDARLTTITYYDSAGNVTGMLSLLHYSGYLFNTDNPTNTVPGGGDTTMRFDAEGNPLWTAGVNRHATVPGVGIVDLDAGRIVWNPLTLSGVHDEITGLAPPSLCAALS